MYGFTSCQENLEKALEIPGFPNYTFCPAMANAKPNIIFLGKKIREAREALSWSQGKLAEAVGFASAQIISSIETGQRELKAWELFRIAKALRVSIESLLTGESTPRVSVEWREKSEAASKEVEAKFIERCRRFKLVEEWCQTPAPKTLSELQLDSSPSFEEVQREADKMWRYTQLGGRPAISLAKTLEEDYGIKIFHEDLEQQGAALSAKGDFGLGVLLNARDASWRRNFSLAHELFHLVAPRHVEALGKERVEQLANVFASQLLLPAELVHEFLAQRTKQGKISYSDLIEAAREFEVSTEALLWRLVNLRKVSREAVQEVLSDEGFRALDRASFPVTEAPPLLPERYVRLCFLAYRKGKLGLAKLADFLETSLVDLAEDISHIEVSAEELEKAQLPVA